MTEPAVDTRGQITVPLEGHEYTLRPSFDALRRIEELTRTNHEHLAQAAVQQSLSYEQMAIICAEMMKAHAKACPNDPLASSCRGAKAENLAKLIFEAGKPKIGARLAVLLVGALSGGYTAEGEPRAAETMEETPAAE